MPKVNFEILRSGGIAVEMTFRKLRGRVSYSKKRGFTVSGGIRGVKKRQ